MTPLHLACQEGHYDIVKKILEKTKQHLSRLLKEEDNEGNWPFHHACFNGNLKVVDKLIQEHGTAVEQANSAGLSPLHIAVQTRNAKLAELLFDRQDGAEVDTEDASAQTPLHYSAKNGDLGMVKLLIDR